MVKGLRRQQVSILQWDIYMILHNDFKEVNILGYSQSDFEKGLSQTQSELAHEKQWKLWTSFYDLGFSLVPCDKNKIPLHRWKYMAGGQQDPEQPTIYQLSEWRKKYNIFQSCNFLWITGETAGTALVCVDADDQQAMAVVEQFCEPTPLTVQRCDHKKHYYYRHDCQEDVKTVNRIFLFEEHLNLDIRGDGGAAVAPYSIHASGQLYLPSQPITKELLDSLPVYQQDWLPYEGSNGANRTSVSIPIEINKDHDDFCADFEVSLELRIEQARKYLAETKGSIQGKGASNYCLAISSTVLIGFAIPQDKAEELLVEWGGRDDHVDQHGHLYPWTQVEIRHKIQSVLKNRTNSKCDYGSKIRVYEKIPSLEEIEETISEKGGWWLQETEDQFNKESLKSDKHFGYLWRNNHARITDKERMARIKSVKEILKLVPKTGFFRDWILLNLPTTDAQPLFHLASSLSLASTLINRKAWITESDDRLYPVLWILLLGTSSITRKTTAMKKILPFLKQYPEYNSIIQGETSTWEGIVSDIGIVFPKKEGGIEQLLDMARNKHIEYQRECLEKGVDFTKGIGVFHLNEIGSWLNNLDKSVNSGTKEIFTNLYDPNLEWKKSTKTQGLYYLYKPFLSILAGSTIDWLLKHTQEEDLQSGFFARFLFINDSTKDYVLSIMDKADEDLRLKVTNEVESIKQSQGEYGFTIEADDFYHDWHKRLFDKYKHDPIMMAWINRMFVTSKKIALLYEISTTNNRSISKENLELACSLIECLAESTEKSLSQISYTPEGKELNKVADKIKAAGRKGIDRAKLLQNCHLKSRQLEELVQTLEDMNKIETLQSEPGAKGKVKTIYRSI